MGSACRSQPRLTPVRNRKEVARNPILASRRRRSVRNGILAADAPIFLRPDYRRPVVAAICIARLLRAAVVHIEKRALELPREMFQRPTKISLREGGSGLRAGFDRLSAAPVLSSLSQTIATSMGNPLRVLRTARD